MASLPRKRRISIGLCMAAVALTSGCGNLIEPDLSPDPIKVEEFRKSQRSLPSALAVAESLAEQYQRKVEDQIVFSRLMNLGLIGAAGAAAGLVATAAPPVYLVAPTGAAAAAIAADSILSSKPQQVIYAEGANTLHCAISAMSPLIVAYRNRNRLAVLLDGSVAAELTIDGGPKPEGPTEPFSDPINEAGALLASVPAGAESPNVLRARAALAAASAMQETGQQALDVLIGAGQELDDARSDIQDKVTRAIIDASPTVAGLAGSLGLIVSPLAKPLTVSPSQPLPKTSVKTSSPDLEPQLVAVTHKLEQRTAAIGIIVRAVNRRPSTANLAACGMDVAKEALKIDPAEKTVAAPTGDVPTVVSFDARGGVLPYSYPIWNGIHPPTSEVELTKFDTGQGTAEVTVKKGAHEAAYALVVNDSANNEVTAVLRVGTPAPEAKVGGTSVPGTAGTTVAAAPTCAKEPQVEKVQHFLLAKDVKKVSVGGVEKEVTVDACWGEVTDAAIVKYLKGTGMTDQDIRPGKQGHMQEIVEIIDQVSQ